jgi:hypothetical protein
MTETENEILPTPQETPANTPTDEAYLQSEECNVATAAASFVKIAQKDECDGNEALGKLQPLLDDKSTPPEKWFKIMTEITEEATCDKLKYVEVLGELTQYLEKRDSPILKNIDKGIDSLSTTP